VAPLAVADRRVRLVPWELEDQGVAVVSRVLQGAFQQLWSMGECAVLNEVRKQR
jgi:hypothetical protein